MIGTRSLRLRLALLFTVVGLIVLTLMVTSAVAYSRLLDDRAALVDRTDPALQHLGALLTAYVNQETGVRGFVLTRDEAFLEPYDQGLAADSAESAFLRQAMQDNAGLTRDLASVEQAAGRWHDQFASPAIAAARAGEDSFASDVALANSKALFDGVRAAVDTMQGDLEVARQRAKDQLDATSNQLAALMVASAIVLVATGVLLWWALRRWVTDPLGAVGNDARTVTAGDLAHEVARAGPPEIADLAGDIEAMRERIVRQLATVAATGEALQTANADLVRSNEELEQFAYVASHDLQEPLRKVASFCQLLEQRYGGQLDERGQQYIDFAVDGAKRMQNLINDLLAFSRVGRTTERFVPVELHTCVDGALRNLSITIDETGASIDVEDDLPVVDGDRGLLTALFQNLIANSLKFRSEASPAVRITASQQDGEVTMAVADNGIGIDERFADRIFVIFQRLHGREAYDGTGIGLAMCRKIVEFHGGRIWLDTSYERGSRFWFTLPVAAEEA